jgi:phage terminase large subunit
MANQIKVPEYSASERQTIFHTSEAFETLYGGAAGGGKTTAIVAEAITYALEYPKARIYIFRRTIPELKQSIVPEIYKQCSAYIDTGGMKYNSQDRTFTFRNGSIIQLAYLENPADMFRYQSAESHLLLVDELTHFSQEEYEYLKTRVRSTGEHPLKVMAATNPGNIGHGWVKQYFIDIAVPETVYTDKSGNSRMFVPAKIDDHPIKAFRDSYGRQLDSLSDPDLKRALRNGDWDIFSGQVFTEWEREKHVVDPFAIPSHWTKWLAYDWGYNTYAACLWLARDPTTERIYIYREFYQHAMSASVQAETINSLSGDEKIVTKWADPSLWKQHGNVETGESVAVIFQKAGLIFQPANNDRKNGMNAVHESLDFQADGVPQLQVFSSCINLIRTLPSLPYDKNKIEDVDTRAEDHLYDCLRYALVNQRPAQMPEMKINEDVVRRRMKYA